MADIQDFKTLKAKRKSLGVSQVQLAAKAGINVAILANVECGRRRLSLDLAKILYGAIAEIERERTDTIKSLEAVLDDPNSDGGATVKAHAKWSEERLKAHAAKSEEELMKESAARRQRHDALMRRLGVADELSEEERIKRRRLLAQRWVEMSDEEKMKWSAERRQRFAALLLRAKALAVAIEGCEAAEAEIDGLIEKYSAEIDRLK